MLAAQQLLLVSIKQLFGHPQHFIPWHLNGDVISGTINTCGGDTELVIKPVHCHPPFVVSIKHVAYDIHQQLAQSHTHG